MLKMQPQKQSSSFDGLMRKISLINLSKPKKNANRKK